MEEELAPSCLLPVPVSVTTAMALTLAVALGSILQYSHTTRISLIMVTLRDTSTSQLAFSSQRSAPSSVKFVL